MVKICRVPSHVRRHFTHNELSGWADVRYSYKREPKKERQEPCQSVRPPVHRLSSGIKLL